MIEHGVGDLAEEVVGHGKKVSGVRPQVSGLGSQDTDYFLKINKGIDTFGRVYKEITMNYVDEVDPEKFMEAGIDVGAGSDRTVLRLRRGPKALQQFAVSQVAVGLVSGGI